MDAIVVTPRMLTGTIYVPTCGLAKSDLEVNIDGQALTDFGGQRAVFETTGHARR